jgi:hypothetical protein
MKTLDQTPVLPPWRFRSQERCWKLRKKRKRNWTKRKPLLGDAEYVGVVNVWRKKMNRSESAGTSL